MAIDEFAECYAGHVERTVDQVVGDIRQIGADALRSLLAWYRTLGDADRAFVVLLAGKALDVLGKILVRVVGPTAAAALIALAGGASWYILINAFIACEARL